MIERFFAAETAEIDRLIANYRRVSGILNVYCHSADWISSDASRQGFLSRHCSADADDFRRDAERDFR
jgi:hypothetical protein